MHISKLLFDFKSDISELSIPETLNNPFSNIVPALAKIAAAEFQEYLSSDVIHSKHDFHTNKGKMFGVMVVQSPEGQLQYLGAISGKIPTGLANDKFVPSVFDDSVDDYFINKGMTRLTEMSEEINKSDNPVEIKVLKENRRLKSTAIQQQLFEHYLFLNLSGVEKDLLEIFKHSVHGWPPSASGECAAPKLLQHTLRHGLKPIALAEFWWGNSNASEAREHKNYYPACKNKCRPILEYMLEDQSLYTNRV